MKGKLKINYLCPACRSYLRVWNNVIFAVKSTENDKKGILLLNPGLGNYAVVSHPDLTFETGEKIDFFCPVCQTSLVDDMINENLVRVIMIDELDNEYDVYFSRVAGEQSTFKVDKEDIIERYGDDHSSYVSYFMKRFKVHQDH